MITVQITTRTPRLEKIKAVVSNMYKLNEEICMHFMREIDRNIVEGGIWNKFPNNKESTTYKRQAEGKDPRAMFGLRGKFKYTFGKTQFTIYSDDPSVIRMHEGPKKKRWTITPKNKLWLSFPHPAGRPRPNSEFLWIKTKKVIHKGWERRTLMPPAYEIGYYTRELIKTRLGETA